MIISLQLLNVSQEYFNSNTFVDPYEDISTKIAATFCYFIGIISSIVMFDFLKKEFENNNKTIFNLLLASAYTILIIYVTLCIGMDLMRAWVGPFPLFLCQLQNIAKGTLVFAFYCALFAIFVLRFFFVVIWSKMKIINDFLVLRIIILTSFMIGNLDLKIALFSREML